MTVQNTAPPLEPGDPGYAEPGKPTQTENGEALSDQETYEDYYGFESSETWYFPDGKQFILFKRMNEGERAKFQKMTTRDVTVVRNTGDAKVKVDPATERHELIVQSVTGWSLMRRDRKTDQFSPVPFSKGSPGAELERWLDIASPTLIDDLEMAIRKANPWLQADMTLEDIDKEMDRLRELREQVEEKNRGEGSSSSK